MAKEENPKMYGLPDWIYFQVLAFIRGYDERQRMADEMTALASPLITDLPRGTGISDPTARMVMMRARLLEMNNMIDDALLIIEDEYVRRVVFDWVKTKGMTYEEVKGSEYVSESTAKRGKASFVRMVARNMGLLELTGGDDEED